MTTNKSFSYVGTMMQLLHDYAATRLMEIREEAKMLESFLGPSVSEESSARPRPPAPDVGALQALVLREVQTARMEVRPGEVLDRLTTAGWQFKDVRSGKRAVANALIRLTESGHLRVRKNGVDKRSPVFYSVAKTAESETEGV